MREEALVNTLANGLPEVEAKALNNILDVVEAKALVDMLADTLVQMDGETCVDTINDVLTQILVDT